jgi:hypothetical protein
MDQTTRRPRTVSALVVIATSLAIGLLVGLAPHYMFDWCEFTEFGYLGRIPAALVSVVVGALAVGLVVAGGLMGLLGRRRGGATLLAGIGLGAGVALSWLLNIPAC